MMTSLSYTTTSARGVKVCHSITLRRRLAFKAVARFQGAIGAARRGEFEFARNELSCAIRCARFIITVEKETI